jgi:hypothetical protein
MFFKEVIMQELKSVPKGSERPPICLYGEHSDIVEKPTTAQIRTEISLGVIAPFRVAFELLHLAQMDKDDDILAYKEVGVAVGDVLFVALERWKQLSGYL